MSLMQFTHYLFGYVGTTMCSIGLTLALCSVYIFTRRQMRSVVSTYLAALSISDSCLLFLGLIFAINSSIPPNRQSESFYSSRLHKYLFPYVYTCIIWFQFTSVWIIIGFAIDRWFAIRWPMLHYTYSSKRASYIVMTIYCLGFIYSLPRLFEYKTEVRREELAVIENDTEYIDHIVITNKVHNNPMYQYIVHLILYSLLQSILPLLLLSYFNVELIRSVHASSHFRRNTPLYGQNIRVSSDPSTVRYRESVITRSVVCLIGLFTICQVPASILHYIYMFYRHHKWLYICYDISNFLILFNSAANFFVFAFFNRKFRRELAYVCFHTKDHGLFSRFSNHVSIGRSSSRLRTLQQIQFNDVHPKYLEYPKRSNNTSNYPPRKKSSESAPQLRSIYRRANSLKNDDLLTYKNRRKSDRSSMCELPHKRTSLVTNQEQKSINFASLKSKYKSRNDRHRCNSEKYSPHSDRFSVICNPNLNNGYCREQRLHYVTLRYKNNPLKTIKASSCSLTEPTAKPES